jgi:hypothetical protein
MRTLVYESSKPAMSRQSLPLASETFDARYGRWTVSAPVR